MVGEWTEEAFPEAIDFQEGPGILAKDFRDEGVPLVRLAGLDRGGSVLEGCNYLDPKSVAAKWAHFGLAKGDILLSTSASLGRIAVVGDDGVGAVPYTGIIRMRPRDARLIAPYIRYLLEGPDFQQQAEMVGTGSVIRHFGPTHLRKMSVWLPPPEEQRAIAHILGTLDDKIELNRRMNETLEAMGRALFKSWFVDFDPVRAKAQGRDPAVPEHLGDVFPDSLEDSELGEIPKGWTTRPLYETAKYINGAAFKSEEFCPPGEGLPVIKIAELKGGINPQTKWSARQAGPDQLVDTGDLLYSWSGSPDTSLDAFLWANGRGLLNQHIFKVATPSTAQKRFVYYLLKYLRPILVETARNKQTTGLGHVTVADLKRLLVCWPTKEISIAFDEKIAPIFDRVFANTIEVQTLAAIRDVLLPMLLSGAIGVKVPEIAP